MNHRPVVAEILTRRRVNKMPGPGRQPRGMKAQVKNPGELFLRLMKYVLKDYKFHCISVVVLIVVSVLCNVQGTMFMKNLIDEYITPFLLSDNPNFTPLAHAIARVAAFYALGVLATFGYNRLMVNVTQGTLRNLRNDLFSHMEKLPVKYFDTHAHGDIMSVYTNDIDTLRQMISQSMPQLLNSGITIISVFVSMLILSIPLTVVTMIMVGIMVFCSKKSAGQSGAYFAKQQKDLGTVNGYIEEMMNGQKVVKVFCHEEENMQNFKKLNDELYVSADKANTFANFLGPINAQIGNISYVICAIIGGVLALGKVGGFTLGGLASFLTFNKSFSMPINQISMQMNAIVMAMAGADRIFKLMDEKEELDENGKKTEVKICGITSEADARLLIKYGADYGGMVVFYPKSKRDITIDEAGRLVKILKESDIKTVAVTVSPDTDKLRQIQDNGFDYIQIHGELYEDVYNESRIPIIRAVNIGKNDNMDDIKKSVSEAAHKDKIVGILLDAGIPGSGKTFDWNGVKELELKEKKLFLAGGLNSLNVAAAVKCAMPDVVDISTGVEYDDILIKGKDEKKVKEFILNARK